MRTRSERRHKDWAKASRKRRICVNNFGFEYYDNLHEYSKNKIHCSCPMCSVKTNNKHRKASWEPVTYWSMRDQKRIDEMTFEENDLNREVGPMDRSNVDVEVIDLDPFVNKNTVGVTIHWVGTPGFGEYTLYRRVDEETWHADSEFMDSQDDKWFLNLLLKDLVDKRLIIDQ